MQNVAQINTKRPLAAESARETEELFDSLRARLNEAAAAFVIVDGQHIHASDDHADAMVRADFSVAIARALECVDALEEKGAIGLADAEVDVDGAITDAAAEE